MVTMVTERRVLNCRQVDAEYDGRWVLFDHRDFPPEEDTGYVVAYGDGTTTPNDVRKTLQRLLRLNQKDRKIVDILISALINRYSD
jgi:hypothetical protein